MKTGWICVFLFLFSMPAFADDLPDYRPYLPEIVSEALSEEWLSAFLQTDGSTDGLLSYLRTLFVSKLQDALSGGAMLFGMLIVLAICRKYSNALSTALSDHTIQFASMLCMGLAAFRLVRDIWGEVHTVLVGMQGMLAALVPTITTLTLAGANTAAAGVYSVGATWVVSAMQSVLVGILYPALHVSLLLLLIGSVSKENAVMQLAAWIRKTLVWLLVLGMSTLALVLSVQSTIAQSADSVTAKTMKFALGNTIPFVGAAVGETVRTVSAALVYLRSAVGVAVICALCALLFPTVLHLLLYKFVFSLLGQLAEMVENTAEGKLLLGVSDVLNIALAILASAFLCSFFLLALFSKTAVAFV